MKQNCNGLAIPSHTVGYIHGLSILKHESFFKLVTSKSERDDRPSSVIYTYPCNDCTSWASKIDNNYGQFVQFEFNSSIHATHYSFKSFSSTIYPKCWNVSSSLDGIDWILQDNHINDDVLSCGGELIFSLRIPGYYKYFRLTNTGMSSYEPSPTQLYVSRFDIHNIYSTLKYTCDKSKNYDYFKFSFLIILSK